MTITNSSMSNENGDRQHALPHTSTEAKCVNVSSVGLAGSKVAVWF